MRGDIPCVDAIANFPKATSVLDSCVATPAVTWNQCRATKQRIELHVQQRCATGGLDLECCMDEV